MPNDKEPLRPSETDMTADAGHPYAQHGVFNPDSKQAWHNLLRLGYERGRRILFLCAEQGFLNPREVKTVLEFGPGTGGPTTALVELANQNGGEVEAVDISEESSARLVELGVLPKDKITVGDGIDYLQTAAAAGKTFDLIAAFYFSRGDIDLATQLIRTGLLVLSTVGKLMINTDRATIESISSRIGDIGISFGTVEAGQDLMLGQTIVISRSNMSTEK